MVKCKPKRKVVPVHKRTHVRDCEPGDRFRVTERHFMPAGLTSREFVASNWLNGGPMAREVVDGTEGELEPIDGNLRMELT